MAAPVAALLLAACASTGPAPVEDRSLGAPRATPGARKETARPSAQPGASYRVQRGDTLYSIAFRHGVDYRELAGWNGISAPYTIYVGQELRVAPHSTGAPVAAAVPTTTQHPVTAATPTPAPVKPSAPTGPAVPKPAPFETVAGQSSPVAAPNPPPAASSPVMPSAPAPNAPAVATEAAAKPVPSPPPPPSSAATVSSSEVAWRWPADGQVVAGFVAGDQTRQGIDIAGKSGDPVRAAADGSVVYSGNGLIGYGELIIVKHSPGFLSAYGHNRKRLVKEGDRVKSGQVIAEMGSSSANRDSLHFEIRKNGKPANPIDYLPRH
ncbi:peptidoglycan DD-metalloendopeptidase family protein [Dokdonella soli]|uniref:LysM domain-containing protein n=1 Tax=Dokdonella soli TaxID=529810 RepID=A0ABN1IJ16_9GAMM